MPTMRPMVGPLRLVYIRLTDGVLMLKFLGEVAGIDDEDAQFREPRPHFYDRSWQISGEPTRVLIHAPAYRGNG